MFVRAAVRRFSGAAASSKAVPAGGRPVVPNCLCQFGNELPFAYLNHPGVMAVSTMVELRGITRMRANFTQNDVDALKEYDIELARKAQIAHDNGLAINFLDLERIEETLPRLLKEKAQLEEARKEVLGRKVGDYGPIKTQVPDCKPKNFKLKMPESYRKQLDK